MDLLDDLVLVGGSHEDMGIGKRREHDDYTLDSRKCEGRYINKAIEYHLIMTVPWRPLCVECF